MLIIRSCLTGIRKIAAIAATIPVLLTACNKDPEILTPGASLAIIAAIPDADRLYTSFAGTDRLESYVSSSVLNYSNYTGTGRASIAFTRPAGDQRLAFYRRTDTVNPGKPLMALNIPLKVSGIYSLFLTGTAAAPDTIFMEDIIPWHSIKDSVTGLRFINLSPGSNPISINIAGKIQGSEVDQLPYKSVTAFTMYPADASINDYTFEFRDKVSGKLLATYNTGKMNKYASTARLTEVNKWLFRNSTLVFLGLPDGQGVQAQKVAIVNHFTLR